MPTASNVYSRRRLPLACVVVLTVVFFFRAYRQVSLQELSSLGDDSSLSSASQGYKGPACEWQEDGGAHVFFLKHAVSHPKAGHWFHVAESFTGHRAELENTIAAMNGTLYLQVLDSKWMSGITPMSRLLILAGLVGVDTKTVHFIDENRASFFYPSPQKKKLRPSFSDSERSKPPAIIEAGEDNQPLSGQVGLLHYSVQGKGKEFITDLEQPLPERLILTAEPREIQVSSPDFSVRGATKGSDSSGDSTMSTPSPVCVKFENFVGSTIVQRVDWFPNSDDAMSLRKAIDSFCPISWLRDDLRPDGEKDGVVGVGGAGSQRYRQQQVKGGEGGGGGGEGSQRSRGDGDGDGKVKHMLLYQRDQNRKLVDSEKVIEKLKGRLGDGWIVNKMTHDPDRHPCDLVRVVARSDVLLTAHGFQSMLGLFMRPGALLFEIFPHKYFKAGYAPMAEGLGVRHAFSESRNRMFLMGHSHPTTETCMNWYICRWYTRQANVELDDESMGRLVDLALETEN